MHVSLSRLHGVLLHILCKSVFMNYFVAKECGDMLKATSGVNTKKTPVTLSGTYCGSCCKLSLKNSPLWIRNRNEIPLYKRCLKEGYDLKTDD